MSLLKPCQSSKAKERKMKRTKAKEFSERSYKLVEAANQLEDPLASFPSFQKYSKRDMDLTISCQRSPNVAKELMQWAYELTKQNMESMYNQCGWGWNEKKKLREMKDDNAIYLFARAGNKEPMAFIHFRFDIEDGFPIVYCYEIQLEDKVRRKGLGRFMMQILILFAMKNDLFKVMASVFRANRASMNFFTEKLKFVEDKTSPEDETYVILSKVVKNH